MISIVMEIEQSIVVGLSESRNYSKLYHETVKIRRQANQTLSKESFNNALKRLVEDKIVTKKKVTGREMKYFLDLKKAGYLGKQLLLDTYEEDSLTWLEERLKILEENIDEIKKLRKNSSSNNEKKKVKDLTIVHKKIILVLLKGALISQKKVFLQWSIEFPPKSNRRRLQTQLRRYYIIINVLARLLVKLDGKKSLIHIKDLMDDIDKEKTEYGNEFEELGKIALKIS